MIELNLPKETFINRNLSKKMFYENIDVSKKNKQEFIDYIDKITWLYKLSTDTIRITETEDVVEIQIFEIELKEKVIPKNVLSMITSKIPYPILFNLKYNNDFIFGIKHDNFLFSEWNKKIEFNFTALNLKNLYEKIVLSVIGKDTFVNDFQRAINKSKREIELKKQIQEFSNKVKNEKQFNRKIELNMTLNKLKKELKELENE